MKEIKTRRDLMKVLSDGHIVEYKSLVGEEWKTLMSFHFDMDNLDYTLFLEYRIKPTKPSINWEHVHPDFKYLARNKCGSAFLYEKEPYARADDWRGYEGYRISALPFASLKTGTCDWKDSLVERPECI